jgi:hypothetical protein
MSNDAIQRTLKDVADFFPWAAMRIGHFGFHGDKNDHVEPYFQTGIGA